MSFYATFGSILSDKSEPSTRFWECSSQKKFCMLWKTTQKQVSRKTFPAKCDFREERG